MVSDKKDVDDIDPNDLSPHTLNITIYGDEEADPELMASIGENGQLEPIVINKNNVIISGHRRWLALKELDRPARCRRIEFEDEADENEALIEFNRQREKVPSQIYNEAKTLKELYIKKGKTNPFDAEKSDVPNSALGGGKTRDKISEATGVKRDKLSKIIEICEKAETGDEFAKELKRRMDSGEKTVHAAHSTLRIYEVSKSDDPKSKFAFELLKKINKGQISENLAFNKVAEFEVKSKKEKTENEEAESTREKTENTKGKYDVLLVNPFESYEPNKRYYLPCTEDSVVFMLADNKNLSITLKIMEFCGFEYKSMCVLNPRKTPYRDPWFTVTHNMLLIGTKGSRIEPAKTEYSSIINFESSGDKTDVIYEMIEAMYPDCTYAYVYVKPDSFKRPGWNGYENKPENAGDMSEENINPEDSSEPVNNSSEDNEKPEALHEVRISTRVYQAIEKTPSLIENVLAVNEYNKDYEMKSDNCTVSNRKTRITADQFSQLNKLIKEHGAKDLNEVIVRLMEGSKKASSKSKKNKDNPN